MHSPEAAGEMRASQPHAAAPHPDALMLCRPWVGERRGIFPRGGKNGGVWGLQRLGPQAQRQDQVGESSPHHFLRGSEPLRRPGWLTWNMSSLPAPPSILSAPENSKSCCSRASCLWSGARAASPCLGQKTWGHAFHTAGLCPHQGARDRVWGGPRAAGVPTWTEGQQMRWPYWLVSAPRATTVPRKRLLEAVEAPWPCLA